MCTKKAKAHKNSFKGKEKRRGSPIVSISLNFKNGKVERIMNEKVNAFISAEADFINALAGDLKLSVSSIRSHRNSLLRKQNWQGSPIEYVMLKFGNGRKEKISGKDLKYLIEEDDKCMNLMMNNLDFFSGKSKIKLRREIYWELV